MTIRRWALLILTMALLSLTALASADVLDAGVTYRSERVNLRQQPTQYSTHLGSYPEGTWMVITGESGNWYAVTAPDGKVGYMSKNYVAVHEPVIASVGYVTNPANTSFLNLRAAPSYGAKVKGTYYTGVPCVLQSLSNGWYSVRVDGVEGYFRAEYIDRMEAPMSDEVATIVTPGNTGLNLREGPGKQYAVLGQYSGGKYVMVLQKGTDWWKVSIGGQMGFMSTEFLKDGIYEAGTQASATANSGGASEELSGAYAVVTNPKPTQVLNLRQSPTTTARVIGQYGQNARVTLLAQGSEWCKVKTASGQTGYMMTKYLTLYGVPGVPTMVVSHPQQTFVNLRSSASMQSNVLARIPHGKEVKVVAPGDGWVKVEYGGKVGYCVNYFLE